MKSKSKYIIATLALVIFITTVTLMIWLSVKPNDSDNYIHKTYSAWSASQNTTGQHYSQFLIDEHKGLILATSKEEGTYVIDASQSIIEQLTKIDTHGYFTSDLLKTIDNTSFGSLFNNSEISIGIWMALSIVAFASIMPMLYMSKKIINKKAGH